VPYRHRHHADRHRANSRVWSGGATHVGSAPTIAQTQTPNAAQLGRPDRYR
jgi:hypothetical protein